MIFLPNDVRRRLRRAPFQPLRIVTSTNQHYDIFHPDLVLIGRRFLIIGSPATDEPGVFEDEVRVALAHVTELRDLPMPTPPAPVPEETSAS